jgi:hypothetical protein
MNTPQDPAGSRLAPTPGSSSYVVYRRNGAWEIEFRGRVVKTCMLRAVADVFASAWNCNRQPSPAELGQAIWTNTDSPSKKT